MCTRAQPRASSKHRSANTNVNRNASSSNSRSMMQRSLVQQHKHHSVSTSSTSSTHQLHRHARARTVCTASGSGHNKKGGKQKDVVMEGLKEFATFLAPTVAAVTASVSDATSTADRPPLSATVVTTSASRPRSSNHLRDTSSSSSEASMRPEWQSPVYGLLLLNLLVHLASSAIPTAALMLKFRSKFHLSQLIFSGFAHTSWYHLAEAGFFIYTFGKVLERSYGVVGLWGTYLGSVLGANLMALWLLPHTRATAALSLSAASAGALGLFVTGLFWPRLLRKPLEVLALAPFVFGATCARYATLGPLLVASGTPVGHLVHVVGASLSASLLAGLLHVADLVRQALEEQQRAKDEEAARASRVAADSQAMADVMGGAAKAASIMAKKLL